MTSEMDGQSRSVGQPYPGLRPFREDEAEIFFGRDKQVDELLERLRLHRFIAVTGPSGCGKSSLVKAGMIPALLSGFMAEAGSRWRVCQLSPGRSPLRALAQALAVPEIVGEQHRGAASADYVEAALRFGPLGLAQVVRESPTLAGASVLVLVDQFEEIFRFRERIDADEADSFVRLLLETARQPGLAVYVVITMRSDYLGDCTVFQGLPEAINDSQYLTPRLTRDECGQAIRGPARVFRGDVEPALLKALLNDFSPDPDQLPLLQHALMRMWQSKAASGGRVLLTREDYTDRFGETLNRHAGEVLAALPPDQQRLAQVMFRRLTERARGRRDTRAPALLSEVAEIAGVDNATIGPVVEAFRREGCNFVVATPGPLAADTLLDIGHESLIRQWKTLSRWVDEEAESAAIYLRLADTARRYAAGHAAMYWGPDLTLAIDWRRRGQPNAPWAQRYRTPDERASGSVGEFDQAIKFLEQCQAERERSQEREREREEEKQQRLVDDARRDAEAEKTRAEQALAQAQATALRRRYSYLLLAIAAGALLAVLGGYVVWLRFDAAQRAVQDEALDAENKRLIGAAKAQGLRDAEWEESFVNFASKRGIPQGVGRALTDVERTRRAVSYVIKTKGRGDYARVIGMRAVDAQGRLTTQHGATSLVLGTTESVPAGRKEVQWQYLYDQNRNVAYELALDLQGRSVVSLVYAPASDDQAKRERTRQTLGPEGFSLPQRSCAGAQVVEFDPATGFEWRHRYMDRFGRAVPGRDSAPVQEHRYNAQGFRTDLVSLNTKLEPLDDKAGNASLRHIDFNEFGQPGRVEYRGADGQLVEIDGQAITLDRYDSTGNLIDRRLFDRHQQPSVGKDGWHRETIDHDRSGQAIKSAYWAINGKPATQANYCHEIRSSYNDRGQRVEGRCIGVDGQPSVGDLGAARWTIEYDVGGNEAAWAYFGGPRLDEPVVWREGWHRLELQHDQRGNIVFTRLLDVHGRPALNAEGYAAYRSRFEYDKETSRVYLGGDGKKPTRIKKGYAEIRRRYDDNGNKSGERYLEADGRTPAWLKDGNAGVVMSHDSCGREISRRYLGADGKPVSLAQGHASEVRSYDLLGRETGLRFLSPSGQPASRVEGMAAWRDTLDRFGNVVHRRYLGVDGRPTLVTSSAAGERQVFDSRGRMVQQEWIDAGGQLVVTQGARDKRYARVTRTFDALGKVLREAYFGPHGQAVYNDDGYAVRQNRYDATGRRASEAFFGLRGEPVLNKRGAHQVRYRNDIRGSKVEERYFGLRGEPVAIIGGFHRVAIEVDVHGRELTRQHFGADGQTGVGVDGWHQRKHRLDSFGNIIDESYFAADGTPAAASADRPHHRLSGGYDAHGQPTEWRVYDLDGGLTSIQQTDYDRRGFMTERRVFDAQQRPVRLTSRKCAVLRWQRDGVGTAVGPSGEAGECMDENLLPAGR